jgi:hypothetical protein
MPSRPQGTKRTLAKKVTSFNMYLDQATQIQAIMEATGADKDAPVLRTLLDEALAGRRRRAAGIQEPDQFRANPAVSETLEALQALLLRNIGLSEKSLQIGGLNLGLLQETLAEAHAARRVWWTDLSVPRLREKGRSSEEINLRFDGQTEDAKQYAYGVARQIMKENKNGHATEHQQPAHSSDEPIESETEENQPTLF